MHESSMRLMEYFVVKYLNKPAKLILDVGSMDVNGSYRGLFAEPHEYWGLDIAAGSNVDIVAPNPYDWPVKDNSFDWVISGQCIEHVENLHLWIKEVARVLKPGGLCCIIGPNTFKQHRYPVDCWRIWPDGMRFLLSQIAHLEVVECFNNGIDTVGIATKKE